MQLIIEIPDDNVKRFSAFLGTECIYYKDAGEPLMKKTGHCSKCGECCKDWGPGHWSSDENGICTMVTGTECAAGMDIPFICALTPLAPYNENCTIKFEQVGD